MTRRSTGDITPLGRRLPRHGNRRIRVPVAQILSLRVDIESTDALKPYSDQLHGISHHFWRTGSLLPLLHSCRHQRSDAQLLQRAIDANCKLATVEFMSNGLIGTALESTVFWPCGSFTYALTLLMLHTSSVLPPSPMPEGCRLTALYLDRPLTGVDISLRAQTEHMMSIESVYIGFNHRTGALHKTPWAVEIYSFIVQLKSPLAVEESLKYQGLVIYALCYSHHQQRRARQIGMA